MKKNTNLDTLLRNKNTSNERFEYLFRGLNELEVEHNKVMAKGTKDANLLTFIRNNVVCKWMSWSGIPFIAADKYGGNGKIAICKKENLPNRIDVCNMTKEELQRYAPGSKIGYVRIACNYLYGDQESCTTEAPDQYVIITIDEFREFIYEFARYISGERYYEYSYDQALKVLSECNKFTWDIYNAIGQHFFDGVLNFTRNEAGRTVLA